MGILHTKINNRITCLKQEYQNNKDVNHQGVKGTTTTTFNGQTYPFYTNGYMIYLHATPL